MGWRYGGQMGNQIQGAAPVVVVTSDTGESRRAYLDVARRLCELLASERFSAGDRIPSELELLPKLGVGRPLLREALVALQATGQLVVRPGAGMFLLVDPSAAWNPGDPSQDLGPSIVEQLDTRMLIECELIQKAALLMTATDLAKLEALVAQMVANDPLDDPKLGVEFHVSIAKASGRPLLASVVESIFHMRQGPMWSTLRQQMLRPSHYRRTIADRQDIVAALRAGDGQAARKAMETMIERVRFRFFEDQNSRLDKTDVEDSQLEG
jgi:GntR family transcriptional repressor for pyruvate dehydrogenase complex